MSNQNNHNPIALIVFPHQLFKETPLLDKEGLFYLVEEPLFFCQYQFHKHKLLYHRSSMKYYADFLRRKGREVKYISHFETIADVRQLLPYLKQQGVRQVIVTELVDNYLHRRIHEMTQQEGLCFDCMPSPQFLTSQNDLTSFFKPQKNKFYHTSFYINQRKQHRILLNENKGPIGGKWSFDVDNRKKYPKAKIPPPIPNLKADIYFTEAIDYIKQHFGSNFGELPQTPLYPHTHQSAKEWLKHFLEHRFSEFGTYEDAIVQKEHFLNHSVLSPMLNNGLITPKEIIDEVAHLTDIIPLNSSEGFVRQIIGWREFIRGIYLVKGGVERTTNFFGHQRKIPQCFYTAETGILPVDNVIQKINKTAYAHHIERLMVLGNFMLLCEFDPDEVYRWFMELFIDAYDWVMVPNVYGMSQFADGGLMATKPYISSSNYIKKMSDYSSGPWQLIWDALYWRFIDKKRSLFINNNRMKFMIKILDKTPKSKRQNQQKIADDFLKNMGI